MATSNNETHITVKNLKMTYDDFVVQKNLNFEIKRGEVFVVMGGSGCGKSTLLRHMIGLHKPAAGNIFYDKKNFWKADDDERNEIMRGFGVLYQSGALWSSMTLGENIELPLGEYTDLTPSEIKEVVSLKLSLVGLAGYEEFYPAELSGGMQKRAGLARAMALDPDILFFDEPSAGLDPVNARLLDELILELRDSLGATVVMVTHELASIFAVADNAVFLDPEKKTMTALGNPKKLLKSSKDPKVLNFLTRGKTLIK